MDNKIFKTSIKNEGDNALHLACDFYGDNRATLSPGQESVIRSTWWMNYAPYKEVIYRKDGTVKALKRTGFKYRWDKGQYTLKILNLHDRIDNYKIGSLFSLSFTIPRGVWIQVPLDARDPLADWESIEVHPDRVFKIPMAGFVPVGGVYNAKIYPEGDQQFERNVKREQHIIFVKRSKPKLQKLQEVRHKLQTDDPTAFEFVDMHRLHNRDRWKIVPNMLMSKEEIERIEAQKRSQIEKDNSYGEYH